MPSIGSFGHLFIISSFVFAILSTVSYYLVDSRKNSTSWYKFGRLSFSLHSFFLLASIALLYAILLANKFEYYYAFQHTSILLPIYFKISAFWEGQEGSFLLWMFWNILIGIYFISRPYSKWNASIIMVISLVQCVLTSMVLGVNFYDIKIGSSPFILLRDVISAPIFSVDPNYVPEDGSGLNPLLQNYWMVIHPPTLFLGFAICIIPFSYAISSLRLRDYKKWLNPTQKYLLLSVIVLGIGIMMGSYWAYETLNFGGYWNWDPVENAVYVPWLFLVASFHCIILTSRKKQYYKMSFILSLSSFILILYSTFLTRSGVLGDSSVHSFTDLGLSGQLLLCLFLFILISMYLLITRWSDIPETLKESKAYSGDFWLFIGILTLILMSFQVILPTSIPVYNAIVELFGGFSNLAPPAEKEIFYSNAQIWFASSLAIFSSIAQVLWWRKNKSKNIVSLFSNPLAITLVLSSLVIYIYPITKPSYMILLTASIFSIFSNGSVLIYFIRKKDLISSASVSHIGLAVMLIGILFSSGYSSIVSKNYTGLVWNNDFPDEVNEDNMLLFVNEERNVGDYRVNYLGERKKLKDYSGYINKNFLELIPLENKYIIKKDLSLKGIDFKENDTVDVDNNDITYFELNFEKGKEVFTLYPKVQTDPNSDMIVFSPDVSNDIFQDLYVHVRTYPDPEQEINWSETDSILVPIDQTFFLNDYVSRLLKVSTKTISEDSKQFVAEAQIKILASGQDYVARPAFIINDNKVGIVPDIIDDLGIKVSITEIIPEKGLFKIKYQTTQKNWVIVEAMQKPFINFMWIGFFILTLGLALSFNKIKLKRI